MIVTLNVGNDNRLHEVELPDSYFPGQKFCKVHQSGEYITCDKGECPDTNSCWLFEFRLKDNKINGLRVIGLGVERWFIEKEGTYLGHGNYYVCLCVTPSVSAAGETITYTVDKTLKKSGPPPIGDASKCQIDKFSIQYLGEDGNPHQLTYVYCAECGCPEWQGFGDMQQPSGKECYLWKRKLNAAENDPYILEKSGKYKDPHRLSGTSDMNYEFGCICVDDMKENLYGIDNHHTTVNGKNGVLKYYPKGAPDF